ncbi:MAG: hypothetical protein M1358_14800 [Chloroflexi bacterium]|nr:hypothetical protein [Chloroflexota bacterium]MCL5960550.1 hypothetical protein [Chloroflexota bacterium]
MLRQLRQRASEALSTARQIVLSAGGPADIQAEVLPCEAVDLALYVLVPRTSDLLFNLESNTLVVATADTWQARGVARLLTPGEYPDRLALAGAPEAEWCEVVEIRPTRLQVRPPDGQGQGETIDIS